MSEIRTALPRFYACQTDVGRHREINEDAHAEYALGDGAVLLVVADGMGGHAAGEVASRIAVEAIGHIAQNSPATDPRDKLRNGFLVANQRILAEAESTGTQGMGTTAVAAYVRGDEAFVAHVGDSRLYHVRNGAVLSRTLDHTRVQKMISMGILPAADAKQHPDANIVTRALGHQHLADGSTLEPEVAAEPCILVMGDSLVLCSDGLYDGVEDEEIAQSLTGRSATEAAQTLVDLANERGGHDNITVTVLHYGTDRGGTVVRPTPAPDSSAATRRNILGAVAAFIGLALALLAVGLYLHGREPEHDTPPAKPAGKPAVAISVDAAVPDSSGAAAVDAGAPPLDLALAKKAAAEPPAEKPSAAKTSQPTPSPRPKDPNTEGRKPESRKPESNKPESNKPESHKPESSKPDSHKPESHKPESSKKDTSSSAKPAAEKVEKGKSDVSPKSAKDTPVKSAAPSNTSR